MSPIILPIVLLSIILFCKVNSFDINKTIENDDFSIELAKYFLKLAGFGYCYFEEMESQNCCPELINDEGWILVGYDKIPVHDFNFAILRNDKYKKVVITFPGTRGMLQFLSEIYINRGVSLKRNQLIKFFIISIIFIVMLKKNLAKCYMRSIKTTKTINIFLQGILLVELWQQYSHLTLLNTR